VTVVLAVLAVPSGGGLSSGEKEDRGNRWVLGAFSVIALLMGFFSSYTDRIGFWTLDGDVLRWVGVVLCFVGRLLRIISGVGIEKSLQRAGGNPAGTSA